VLDVPAGVDPVSGEVGPEYVPPDYDPEKGYVGPEGYVPPPEDQAGSQGLSGQPDGAMDYVEDVPDEPLTNPTDIDINTMSTQDFLALADWQWKTVLTQIVAELGTCARRRAELAPFYHEYKVVQEQERNLASRKSAVQSIMRSNREID